MTVAAPARHAAAAAERTSRVDPRLPTVVLVVAAAVLAVNVVVMFAGGIATGVSIDEPLHVSRLQAYFESEWYLPSFQMAGGQPAPGVEGLYVYGPVAALLAHLVSVIAGAESFGAVEATAAAYASRHVAIGILSVACLVAAAATVRLLTGSWRWAVLGAAVLSSLPVWTGHSMFNIKDAPVAAGYTLVTLGLVALSRPSILSSGQLKAVGVGGIAAGSVIAVGTRPGLWVAVLAGVVALVALTAWVDSRAGEAGAVLPGLFVRGRLALTGLAAAYVLLILVYPQLFAHPDRMIDAVLGSSDYPWFSTILTAGTELSMPPPPSYLPLWFAAQTPVVLLLLGMLGLVAPAWLLLGRGRLAGRARRLSLGAGLAMVSIQALLLPVGAVVTSAVIYDGTRQMLFVQPALAVAATTAAWLVAGTVRAAARPVAYAVLCVGLLVPTAGHVRLFPYDYTWFNAAAASQGIDGRWMTEYWRTSERALQPYVPAEGRIACAPWSPEGGLVDCSSSLQSAPYVADRGTSIDDPALGPLEYYVVQFNRNGSTLPPGCARLHLISRPLFGQDVPMSWVDRCSIPLAEYPAGGITTADKAALGYFIQGWYAPLGEPVWSSGTTGEIAFRAPASWAGRDLRVTLTAAPYGPAGQSSSLDVEVNGESVARFGFDEPQPRALEFTVPAATADAYGEGTVVVRLLVPRTFVPAEIGDNPSPWPLGMQVRGMTVEPAS